MSKDKNRFKKNQSQKILKQQPNIKTVAQKKSFPYEWLLILIIILTAFIYSNSLDNEILNFDDNEYFADYPEIVNFSASQISTYFSNYYVLMYQPLPILSFAITYKYFGMDPTPYHMLNILFHLLNIIVLFVFVRKLTNNKVIALFSAFLFAVHPMSVEAVTWISARSSSMFVFFYLWSLYFYISYIKDNFKLKFYFLTLIFFLLSLFSKAHAVTLPLIILVIDLYLKRKIDKRFILEKIPLFILSLIFGIITISDEGTTGNILQGLDKFTFLDNFFLLSYSIVFYLYRLFVPVNLCPVYVYPEKVNNLLPLVFYVAPFVLAIVTFLVVKFRKKRYILFGFLFFMAAISLTLQIIPSRLFIVTDRYTYLSYIGLYITLGYLLFEIKNVNIRKAFIFITIITGLIFSYLTFQRNKAWSNDFTLATDIISKNPEVPYIARAFGVRANYYLNKLDSSEKALDDYNTALMLDTTDMISFYNRGYLKDKLGDYQGVIEDMSRARDLGINNHLLYNFLGAAYYRTENTPEAIKNFELSIEKNPRFIEPYNNLGAIYGNLFEIEKADYYIDKALEIDPNNIESVRSKGIIYLRRFNYAEACKHWYKAKDLGSKNVDELIGLYCTNQ
ncbi:MAG: hypothetical protein PHT69_03635 [Bacteroidales bacterium]|nr:hypothetical protein [Bacteroidales bacterium]